MKKMRLLMKRPQSQLKGLYRLLLSPELAGALTVTVLVIKIFQEIDAVKQARRKVGFRK